jgi:hypothetical protein
LLFRPACDRVRKCRRLRSQAVHRPRKGRRSQDEECCTIPDLGQSYCPIS